MTYTALYLPSSDDPPEPREFEIEAEAWAFIEDWTGGVDACMAEWLVVPTDALAECETLGDLFEAAGFVRVMPGAL